MSTCSLRRLVAALTVGALSGGSVTAGALALATPALAGPAGPVNDARVDATALGALPATVSVNNTGATKEVGDQFAATIWYSYTPTASRMTVVRADSSYDNTLQVWSGGSLITAVDDGYDSLNAMLTFSATASQTYLIGYGGLKPGNTGPGTLIVGDAVPATPTAPTATAGQGLAQVSWTAPADNGGALTRYVITAYDGETAAGTQEVTGEPPTTSLTFPGLTAGTAYTFTVTAENALGSSVEGPRSAVVTPTAGPAAPAAPTNVSATAGNGTATVTWDAPADNGSVITKYTVHWFDANEDPHSLEVTGSPAPTSASISGLVNGDVYSFYVTATNSIGESTASSSSANVTPATVAGVPTGVSATVGNGTADVTWTAPADNGSAITSYSVKVYEGGTLIGSHLVEGAPPAASYQVTGLTNGHTYTFAVAATNGVGTSAASAQSAAVTPLTNPSAPTGVTATAGRGSAAVTWTAPGTDGGSPVTGYTVYAYDDENTLISTTPATAPATSATVTGLTAGVAYTFKVVATTNFGTSAASTASTAVTPTAATAPAAPYRYVYPGDTKAYVYFYEPDDGGSPVTGYTVRAYANGVLVKKITFPGPDPQQPLEFAGLTNGTAYTFTIDATNDIGTSDRSPEFGPITPRPAPVNDMRANARPIGSVPATIQADNTSATAEPGDDAEATTWYSYTPTADGRLSVSLAGGANSDTYVEVWDGDALVAANDDFFGSDSLLGFQALAGHHYLISYGSSRESVGPGTLTIGNQIPDVPAAPTAQQDNGQATVSWTAPGDHSGPITGYTVRAYRDGVLVSTTEAGTDEESHPDTAVVVHGLTNGVAYTFTVTATNMVGTTAESSASAAVTPNVEPAAPGDVAVSAFSESAEVTWTAPANQGTPVTGYSVHLYDGNTYVRTVEVDGATTSAQLTGLTNGTAYTVRVSATNAAGESAATVSAPFTPALPTNDARANAIAVSAPSRVTVNNRGATTETGDLKEATVWYSYTPTTNHRIGVRADSTFDNTLQVWDGSVLVASNDDYWDPNAMLGLDVLAGHTYKIAFGSFHSSLDGTGFGTLSITDQVPDTPLAPTATPMDSGAQVSWTAPADHLGPITGYTVRAYDGETLVSTTEVPGELMAPATTATVTGLRNQVAYRFTVTANNLVGPSAASALSGPVTPVGAPYVPADVTATAGDGRAQVSWTAPENGGSPITGYTVRAYTEGGVFTTVQVAAPATTVNVPGLINGVEYTFTVTATNTLGTSAESDFSDLVTPDPLAPPNDDISNAIPLGQLPVTLNVDNTNATWTSWDEEGYATIWYSYTPTTDRTIQISARNDRDTTVEIWENGVKLGANDDYFDDASYNSMMTFDVLAGHTYRIAYGDATNDDTGPGQLTVTDQLPAAPAAPTGAAGDGEATVSWNEPVGGGEMVGYTVTAYDGDTVAATVEVGGDYTTAATSATVSGLTNGTAYRFTVVAHSLLGSSVMSARSAPVTPSAPSIGVTNVTGIALDGAATVRWQPPNNPGTLPRTGYTVTASPGGASVDVPIGTNSTTVPGLTNGTVYTFTVTAHEGQDPDVVSAPSAPVRPSPIQGRFQALGGATGSLGAPLAAEHTIPGGAVEEFARGSLYWSAGTGAIRVSGAILPEYVAVGGPSGLLGFPTADEADTPGATGRFSSFQRGGIYWSFATGAHEVHGAISARFRALGGAGGLLGFPTTDETATVGAAGRFNAFQHGVVFFSMGSGAHEVHGDILARYGALGGPAGLLGFPVADETATVGAAGRTNGFQRGAIYWSPRTGAHELHGVILAKYVALHGPASVLGFPVTDELATPDGRGRYNTFQGGSIYWTPALGAHEVHGAILGAWAAGGYEHGPLGYPVSDEYSVGGNRRSDFTGGSVVWDATTGRTTVTLR